MIPPNDPIFPTRSPHPWHLWGTVLSIALLLHGLFFYFFPILFESSQPQNPPLFVELMDFSQKNELPESSWEPEIAAVEEPAPALLSPAEPLKPEALPPPEAEKSHAPLKLETEPLPSPTPVVLENREELLLSPSQPELEERLETDVLETKPSEIVEKIEEENPQKVVPEIVEPQPPLPELEPKISQALEHEIVETEPTPLVLEPEIVATLEPEISEEVEPIPPEADPYEPISELVLNERIEEKESEQLSMELLKESQKGEPNPKSRSGNDNTPEVTPFSYWKLSEAVKSPFLESLPSRDNPAEGEPSAAISSEEHSFEMNLTQEQLSALEKQQEKLTEVSPEESLPSEIIVPTEESMRVFPEDEQIAMNPLEETVSVIEELPTLSGSLQEPVINVENEALQTESASLTEDQENSISAQENVSATREEKTSQEISQIPLESVFAGSEREENQKFSLQLSEPSPSNRANKASESQTIQTLEKRRNSEKVQLSEIGEILKNHETVAEELAMVVPRNKTQSQLLPQEQHGALPKNYFLKKISPKKTSQSQQLSFADSSSKMSPTSSFFPGSLRSSFPRGTSGAGATSGHPIPQIPIGSQSSSGMAYGLNDYNWPYESYMTRWAKALLYSWSNHPPQDYVTGLVLEGGNVFVLVTLNLKGELTSYEVTRVEQSSELMVTSVLDAIQGASNLPPLPADFKKSELTVHFKFIYPSLYHLLRRR